MCAMRRWLVYVLACYAFPVTSVLTLRSGSTDLQSNLETCVLEHFGPQSDEVDAPAVYLSGNVLCNPDTDTVRDKVVIGILRGASKCNYMTMYRRLDSLGAVGFVKLVQRSPPCWSTAYDHDVWDPSETQDMTMTMVEVFAGSVKIGPGEAAAIIDFRAVISPPHNTEWNDADSSMPTLITMRILTPILGFIFVVLSGLNESLILWRTLGIDADLATAQMRQASFLVCIIASVCSFIICVLLGLGQYNVSVAPVYVHNMFLTLFGGTTILTTSICCAVLIEKFRGASSQNFSLRILTKEYPILLLVVIILGPVIDFTAGYFSVNGLDEGVNYMLIHTLGSVGVCLIQAAFGLVFVYFANALGKTVLDYLRMRSSLQSSDHIHIVRHLMSIVTALVMNGVFLILNVAITIMYAILMQSRKSPVTLNRVFLGLVPVMRLGLFYWQVQLMKLRQRGSNLLERFIVYYDLLCSRKHASKRTAVSPDNVLPQERTPMNDILSSYWDDNTITSTGLTGAAEQFEHSVTFPALNSSSSHQGVPQSSIDARAHRELELNDSDATCGRFVKVVDEMAGE